VEGQARSGNFTQLLERSAQLSTLALALAQVQAGEGGQLVAVSGEAGAGKTALLRAFLDNIGGQARVLWAACDPMLTPGPRGPLMDFARTLGGELVARLASTARAYEVANALLDELGSSGPNVVVVEDAHWADEATLDVVRLLARRVQSVPALVVLSYRDDELPSAHPLRSLLGDLPGRAAVTRIALPRLSLAAVASMASPLGFDPREVHDRTGGNPFFVTEVLAYGDERVPRTVNEAVLARAARLSAQAHRLLEVASVAPGRAEVWFLEAAEPDSACNLGKCLDTGMLVADRESVSFRHELVRLVIEGSLPPDRRRALHRRALEVLEHPPYGQVDLARLSYHAEAAGQSAAVLRYAPLAAEEGSGHACDAPGLSTLMTALSGPRGESPN
jgi:predicted ATPase